MPANSELKVQLGAWIPTGLHRRLKVAAATSGRSMTDIVVAALQAYLDRMEGPHA